MFKLICYINLLLFLTSCNGSATSNFSSTNIATQDTLQYTYNTYKAFSQYFVGTDEKIDTTYFNIRYPEFADPQVNEKMKKFILIDGENTPAEAAQSFIDGFDEFIENSNSGSISAAWTKDVSSHIVLSTPKLLSIVTQVNEYSGGAHGQHYSLYNNLDIQRLEPILLKDIIQVSKLDEFIQIAESQFRKQENIQPDKSLSKDFFFPDGKFSINDNFGLTNENLIIYYNEYEIKPYSEGPTKLTIPYSALQEVLNIRGHEYIQSIL